MYNYQEAASHDSMSIYASMMGLTADLQSTFIRFRAIKVD